MNSFLITGATGVVGSSVLDELLKIKECRVYLLIRPMKNKNIVERKNAVLKMLGVAEDDSRVIAVNGDITQPRLGLSEADEKHLTASLTHIVHCAASLQLDISREESFKHSVESVKHVLQFLSAIRQCKLEYVSTVGVKGRSPDPLPEVRVSPRSEFFNSYEEGKYLAELAVYQAIDRGASITIHRPGMIVGHSQTGRIIHFQVFYHLLKLACGRYTSGIVPAIGDVKIDTVPCDLVAQAIVHCALSPETSGKIIHTCAGFEDSITLRELQAMALIAFRKYQVDAQPVKEIPLGVFHAIASVMKLFMTGSAKIKFNFLPQFLDYASVKQIFENAESKKRIMGWGMTWMTPRQYLPRSLDYYVRSYALRDKESSSDNN